VDNGPPIKQASVLNSFFKINKPVRSLLPQPVLGEVQQGVQQQELLAARLRATPVKARLSVQEPALW
jgi:hypothetical protein